jgi:general secretion pathway protein J
VEGRREAPFFGTRRLAALALLHQPSPGPPPLQKQGRNEGGFTLVELLVALLIFGMLSAAGVALLSFSVRSQGLAKERLGALAETRRAGALLTSDLAQAAPRVARDEAGATRPAFEGGSGQGDTVLIALVRRGWENWDGAPRPSLQKVQYRLVGNRLERRAYRYLDGGPAMEPAVVVDGVLQLSLRYRDKEGAWRDRWDPTEIADLPRALEMVVETEDGGSVRQLFLVGAGA